MKVFSGIYFMILLLIPEVLNATHIRAADIKIDRDCNNPLTIKISIVAYLNTLSNTKFGTNSQVYFGDGSSIRIPVTNATLRTDLGTNIAVATFTTTHTYTSFGNYTVSYIERDRSSGILNITNSLDVPYVTFVNFNLDQNTCNNIPVLSVVPLDKACFKSAFFHSPGAYDVDGDSLSYELSTPASGLTTFANYTSPNNSKFYTNYNQGNEDGNGQPIFKIDPVSGLLTWNAPGTIGEYNIAFKIIEWRKDSLTNTYKLLSTTTRDMQIVVEECVNIRPELTIPQDICVEAGTFIEGLIKGIDGDNHDVKIEVFSEILDFAGEKIAATYSPNPPSFNSSVPYAMVNFRWQTECLHVRQQPYQVVFKITDNPPKGIKLVNFKIWNIKVVAPAPKWKSTSLNLEKRFGELSWENYACSNASKIQIWRKVDSFPYTPGPCDTGLPKFLGYNLIAEVPTSQTNYTDTNNGRGLVVGAKYCYRIMAYFNSPASTPSIVSAEQCIGPIEADAPIITHVSVENTSKLDGKIRVSWRSPFSINEDQFPKPYEYEIYRAKDFYGEDGITKAGRVTDTTFLDSQINTDEQVYNYRIVLYSKPAGSTQMIPVDTSSVASSERLSFTTKENEIELMWRDSVPWSNVAVQMPYHLIYRAEESSDLKDLVLIDSIKVTENGFTYIDTGKKLPQGLRDDRRYTYRIMTRGTYGNPKIKIQENYSQTITTYTISNLKPCALALAIKELNCEEYLNNNTCFQKEFTNELSWKVNDTNGCKQNYISFTLFASSTPDGNYETIQVLNNEYSYKDTGLSSFARCYKIVGVNEKGEAGPASDSICNDNCPYFQLPNVFTPNEDGFNDVFTAAYDQKKSNEDNVDVILFRCPRFVKQIDFKVYNRWGKEVYSLFTENENEVSINWDGRDLKGNELSGGVYYYTADVEFNVLDPLKKKGNFQGWVHIIR